METSDKIVITVNKWNDYQTRKDLKTMAWFRVESCLPEHPAFFELSANGKWFFIFILCLCAKRSEETVETTLNYLEHYSKVPREDILAALKTLNEHGLVKHDFVTGSSRKRSLHNNTLHNNTKQNKENTGTLAFVKPTLEEIQAYIKEKSYTISAEKFFNHYESNGWKVGKNQMKCWKAACASWQSNQANFGGKDNGTKQRNSARDFGKQDLINSKYAKGFNRD